MKFSTLFSTAATGLALFGGAVNAGFDKNSNDNIVLYWGQASAGSEKSLGDYCDETAGDIYVVSFLDSFGTAETSLTISSCTGGTVDGSSLSHCPDVGKDIKKCQKAGKKVLLSLGGAAGSYGFSGDQDGEKFADELWDMFGGGKGDQRPFDDAVVDGFDLDIENNNQKGYSAMVKKLRQHYQSDSSKEYYVSAAPQCVFPDQNVGEALENSEIDFAFVQFYNNPCAVGKSGFNYDTWKDFAENKSPNKDIKLFLGLPGSSSAASSGYVDPDEVSKALSQIKSDSHFGGIMMWDASQAFTNQINGNSYAVSMQSILDNSDGSSSGSGSDSSGSSSDSGSPSASGSSPASSSAAASGSSPAAPGVSSPAVSAAPGGASSAAAGAGAGSPQTSIVATLTSNNVQTSTRPQQSGAANAPAAATSSAASPANAAGGAAAASGAGAAGGPMQTVTPDDASGSCSGQKGQELADCINSSNGGALNKGTQNKQVKDTSDNDSSSESSAPAASSATSSASAPQSTGDDDGSCTDGQFKCQGEQFAMCNFGEWVTFDCAAGTTCKALASGDNAVVGCTFADDQSAGGSNSTTTA